MPEISWWEKEVSTEISQGDILSSVPFSISSVPLTFLASTLLKKGRQGWGESSAPSLSKDGHRHVLANFHEAAGIVISHDCEIDKNASRILIAPVWPVTDFELDFRAIVMARQKRNLLPLPDLPGRGDCYADLRLISPVPRDLLDFDDRIASMSKDGRDALHGQLVAFLLRLAIP